MRLFILATFLSIQIFAQRDTTLSRHSGAFQLGGQTFVSLHYEYSFIAKKHFLLNSNVGWGLYANGDSQTGAKAIYGLHTGLISLIGARPLYFEIGINPTTYFHGTNTFVNLNGWAGLRLIPKKWDGFFIALGYTPLIYTTSTDFYGGLIVGLKLGFNF